MLQRQPHGIARQDQRVMECGQDSSGSVDEVAWETDTELYQLALDGSDLQYIELIGERLI